MDQGHNLHGQLQIELIIYIPIQERPFVSSAFLHNYIPPLCFSDA